MLARAAFSFRFQGTFRARAPSPVAANHVASTIENSGPALLRGSR